MIPFHLDESVNHAIAQGLRSRAVDVTTTTDAELLQAPDSAQIAFAASQGRVLVTHDDDFLRLHAQNQEHAGIAYCHQSKYDIGELIHMLLLLSSCYSSEEMTGRIEFL